MMTPNPPTMIPAILANLTFSSSVHPFLILEKKSTDITVVDELMFDERVDIAAANTAAIRSPATPFGNWHMI